MTRWVCGGLLVLFAVPPVVAQPAPVPPLPPGVPDPTPRPRRPVGPVPGGSPTAPPKFDRHGDPLPTGAVARCGTVRLRHGPEPLALAFAQDGKTLGSLSNTPDGVRAWDPATGKEVGRLNSPVRFAALARDGSVVFVDEDRCRHWVPLTNAVRDLPEKSLPEGGQCLAVNPNLRSFAVGTPQKVVLVDLLTGKHTHELKFPGDQPVTRLVYSSDGRWLAGAGQNSAVFLWDLRTFKRVRTYQTDRNMPDFAFSTDGTRLAVAGERLRVFPTDSEEPVDGYKAPEGEFVSPRFSGDGKWVFAVTNSGDFVRVNAETGEADEPRPAPGDGGLRPPLAVAPEGAFVAAVDQSGGIRIWNPRTGKGPDAERLPVLVRPGFSPDGRTVWALATEGGLHSFDAATGKPGKPVNLPLAEDIGVNWDPAARRATSVLGGDDLVLQVIDADTLKTLGKLSVPQNAGLPVPAFCPTDPNRVALFLQGSVLVCNVATGKTLHAVHLGRPDDSPPSNGAISPDGRLVAVASGGSLTVWELATAKKRFDFGALANGAVGAAFSADGRKLVGWDPTGNVVVFDLRFGTVARRITVDGPGGEGVSVAFSPDGKRLAVGGHDGRVAVWDVGTGDPVVTFDRHDGSVTGLAWGPDGTRVASAATDGTVLVWAVPEKGGAPPEAVVAGFDEAFKLLGSPDAAAAQRGMELLYRNPVEAAKQCRDRVPVPAAAAPGRIAKLIADLDDEEFQVRAAAARDLEAIGGEAVAALKKVAAASGSAEVRKLAGEVATRIEAGAPRADDVRSVRAIEVLEGIGTPEARAVLAAWAAGPPGRRLTTEAAAALGRLKASGK
ncbi:WD40 repeat domain-containing protein [Gemmata sp.]|uniref:WD40 repeat domain-containing protein n=1 Tax=Gemmata sp. TaxID=1914242 RepID=UPI003F70A116